MVFSRVALPYQLRATALESATEIQQDIKKTKNLLARHGARKKAALKTAKHDPRQNDVDKLYHTVGQKRGRAHQPRQDPNVYLCERNDRRRQLLDEQLVSRHSHGRSCGRWRGVPLLGRVKGGIRSVHVQSGTVVRVRGVIHWREGDGGAAAKYGQWASDTMTLRPVVQAFVPPHVNRTVQSRGVRPCKEWRSWKNGIRDYLTYSLSSVLCVRTRNQSARRRPRNVLAT